MKDGEDLIPNARRLGFGTGYPELVGGSTKLHNIPLGRAATTWARLVLANFDMATGDINQLKRAIAILVITICEAARFPRIRALIEEGWHDGTHLGAMDENYVVNWLTFSCAILSYQAHMDWWRPTEGKTLYSVLNIHSVEEALREVDLLLQSKNCSDEVLVYK